MKLPVFAIFRETYSFVFRSHKRFFALAIPAIIITAISSALTGGWLWKVFGQPEGDVDYLKSLMALNFEGGLYSVDGIVLTVLFIITFILSVLVFMMYSIAWHRTYLLPSETVSARSAYRLHKRQLQFFFNYLKLILLSLLLLLPFFIAMISATALVAMFANAIGDAAGWIFLTGIQFAIVIGFLYFYARVMLMFPATAVDNHMKLGEVLRLSRGHGWRLGGIIVLVEIPVILLTAALTWLIGFLSIPVGLFGSLTILLLNGLANQLIFYVGLAFGITALSIAYDRLRRGDSG